MQRIGEHDLSLGIKREIKVIRNDEITIEQAVEMSPERLIISPGPCTPNQSGMSRSLIQHFAGKIPILGVCLGHQAIADVFHMEIEEYLKPMHGKTSEIHHDEIGLFRGLPNPFVATRYHSLIVKKETIPSDFVMNAWTSDGICMGLRSLDYRHNVYGVQFHPESFLTTEGPRLFHNFLLGDS